MPLPGDDAAPALARQGSSGVGRHRHRHHSRDESSGKVALGSETRAVRSIRSQDLKRHSSSPNLAPANGEGQTESPGADLISPTLSSSSRGHHHRTSSRHHHKSRGSMDTVGNKLSRSHHKRSGSSTSLLESYRSRAHSRMASPRDALLSREPLSDGFDDFCIGQLVPMDPALKAQCKREILLSEMEMTGLMQVRAEYCQSKPLAGANIIVALNISIQTLVLVETLMELGATIRWCSSNIASTHDEVAAYAVEEHRIPVYGWNGENEDEFWWCLRNAIDHDDWAPNLIMEDGGDVIQMIHKSFADKVPTIRGVTDESTLGVHRLYQMAMTGRLKCPAMNIADTVTKSKFDNHYGVREVVIDALKRATDVILAGKQVVICGYGDVGKACAHALHCLGATVYITEVDPICALQACMEGYRCVDMETASQLGDIFITATGNKKVLKRADFERMKDNAIVCNMGHYDLEVDVNALRHDSSLKMVNMKHMVDHIIWPDGKVVVLLAEGRLLNSSFGSEGKPSFVMSQSYTNQVLAHIELYTAPRTKYTHEVYRTPRHLDEEVARFHLAHFNAELTELTDKQSQYLGVPKDGPYKDRHYRY